MPSTVFGELEISKSIGHTPVSPPQYISQTTLCYASGNSLNFVDVTDLQSDNLGVENKPITSAPNFHRRSITTGSQISAFATHVKESIVAYSEKLSTRVYVVKWPASASSTGNSAGPNTTGMGSGISAGNVNALQGVSYLKADPSDISIISLTISYDGKYIASLSDMPSFRVTLWDWKSATLLCTAINESPAAFISFNPQNSKQLCTSGGGSDIRFWNVIAGWKNNILRGMDGSTCAPLDPVSAEPPALTSILERFLLISDEPTTSTTDPPTITEATPSAGVASSLLMTPFAHTWQSGNLIVNTWETGDLVTMYAPNERSRRILFSTSDTAETATVVSGKERSGRSSVFRMNREDYGGSGNFMCLAAGKDIYAFGGKDGVIRLVTEDGEVVKEMRIPTTPSATSPITSICFSPDYRQITVSTRCKSIHTWFLESGEIAKVVAGESSRMVSLNVFRLTNTLVVAYSSGLIKLLSFPPNTAASSDVGLLCSWSVSGDITSISAHPFSHMLAIGTSAGILRVYDCSKVIAPSASDLGAWNEEKIKGDVVGGSDRPRLLYRERLYDGLIAQTTFDPTGHFLITRCGNDIKSGAKSEDAFLLQVTKGVQLLGFITAPAPIEGLRWDLDEATEDEEDFSAVNASVVDTEMETGVAVTAAKLSLCILTYESGKSFIGKYNIPLAEQIRSDNTKTLSLSRSIFPTVTYKIQENIIDFCPVPTDVSATAESFFAMCLDKKLKVFGVQSTRNFDEASGIVSLGAPILEYQDHEKSANHLDLSISRDWLFTWSADGRFTVRNLLEQEKSVSIYAHDPFQGGVAHVACSRDSRWVYSLGVDDGLLRIYDWKGNGSSSGRARDEATANAAATIELQSVFISKLAELLVKSQECDDVEDSTDEICIKEKINLVESEEVLVKNEQASAQVEVLDRIQNIRTKLIDNMQKNNTLPAIEQLSKEDFILDFSQRDKLWRESDAKVKAIRTSTEEENMKKRVLRNRIKHECWDSMEVTGQSVKSFHTDPVTTRVIEVLNYPIKKRESTELIDKIKCLRKTQIIAAANDKQQQKKSFPTAEVMVGDEGDETSPTTDGPPPVLEEATSLSSAKGLLYEHLELITNERRRIQIMLLDEVNNEIKLDFNDKFKDVIKMKQDDIVKIEEKNERIQNILAELQIQDTIFHPTLDDDEIPERIIEVRDSEVKAEKFITAEERRRLEEKRLQEEERRRAQQSDNSRERALMMMMGGKLEDRSEETEKEDLVRPEWMNKPRDEMNEEERKLVKEFEKKLATFKEEQEKYRKALETELKKLQGSIQDIGDGFDQKLRDFFNVKMNSDQTIYQNELKMIKMSHAILLGESNEFMEKELIMKLDELKAEKLKYMSDIPEIKKEVEHYREDYDQSVRRDKEIERQFKKEFHTGDATFEGMFRLFKRRQADKPATKPDEQVENSLSPFAAYEKSVLSTVEVPQLPLVYEFDQIEGVSQETFSRLSEIRDRKIASEAEVRQSYQRLSEAQLLLQVVLDENEKIKKDTDKCNKELAAFAEYKFQCMYNLEGLFELKQGQVEVPQAPVVTVYSDAALIHRSVVEKLNDSIVALGQTKVEALKEMKEYRKGIHALEWENKMLDFQAEDLVIRTRDIQLVTKQMQEYIRGGEEWKQTAEVAALEKRAEYSQKAHQHKLEKNRRTVSKLLKKVREKEEENRKLDDQISKLELEVHERTRIYEVQAKKQKSGKQQGENLTLKEIYTRRKLVDLAKSQAQDIAILREEVERLRLRTYPAFPLTSIQY